MGVIDVVSSLAEADLQFMRGTIEIPNTMRQYLLMRPQDIDRIRLAVASAVEYSFNHPETRMRNPTQRELKMRAQLAMDIVEQLYLDDMLVTTQIVDQLPELLIGIIRDYCVDAQEAGRQEAAKQIEPGRWTKDLPGEPETVKLDEESVDLTEEALATPEDETGEDGLEGLDLPSLEEE